MTLPVLLHWKMQNAPQLKKVNGAMNALHLACLVNGFNTITATATNFTSGVGTFTLASHGFSVLDTVLITSNDQALLNNKTGRVITSAAGSITVAVTGVPDGAVTGTVTVKFAPLGWTRPFSGTSLGAYKQGGLSSTKRFLRISDSLLASDNIYYYVRGYENMTAVSTGTGPFPTTTLVTGNGIALNGVYSQPSTEIFPWIIVGTPRAFYFLHGRDGAYTLASPLTKADSYYSFFGELSRINKPGDAYAHLITGTDFPPAKGYLNRGVNGITSSVTPDLRSVAGNYGLNCDFTYPDPADSSYKFFDAPLITQADSLTVRGFLPGILTMSSSPIYALAALPGDILANGTVTGISSRLMLIHSESAGGPYSDGALLLDEDWGDS